MDEIGKRVVAALIVEGDLAKLTHAGISADDLLDDAKVAYDWAFDFYKKTQTWPDAEQIEENTGVTLPQKKETLEYACELARKRKLGKAIESGMRPVLRDLQDRDPDEALAKLGEVAVKLRQQVGDSDIVSFREKGGSRFARYQEQKKGLRGVVTPWKALNQHILGWMNGQLHVIMATMATGKSWSLCLISDFSLSIGKRVLFVTLEMSTERIERRLDAVKYRIPFGDLRDAEVDLFTELRWEDQLAKEVVGKGDILIADKKKVRYVADVTALVIQYKPDLVLIDGGYRFQSRKSKDDWESAKAIVAELQTTAELTDLPWIVTTQQGDVSQKDRLEYKQRAYKVKYAKEWVINPDIAIEMYQNEDLQLLKRMEWRLLRERDSKGSKEDKKFITSWDLEEMEFGELDLEDEVDISGGVSY